MECRNVLVPARSNSAPPTVRWTEDSTASCR